MTDINSKKLKAVIASPDIYPDSVEKLKSMDIEVLFSCKNTNVSPYLAYHADMQITKIDDKTFVCAPECYDYYKNILEKFNVNIIKGNTYLSCNYPEDIAYNIIVTEKYAVHNFKHTDSILKSNLNGRNLINVSQGYTGCILCVISDKACITSDAGIYNKMISLGFDVLKIDDNSVVLNGFDHGFFAGSSFMLFSDTLAVNGNVKSHIDYLKIKEFCLGYGVKLLSLSEQSIMDIGSLIPV